MRSGILFPIIVLLLAGSSAGLYALDYSAEFISESEALFSTGDDSLSQGIEADVFGSQSFGSGLSVELGGFLRLDLDSETGNSPADMLSGDITRAAFRREHAEGRGFGFSVGRLEFRDFSALVLDAPADGFRVEYAGADAVLAGQIGITGLLLNEASPYNTTYSEDARDKNFLAPSRMISRFDAAYTGLSADTVLYAELIGNLDLPEEKEFQGDIFDSFTLEFGLTGSFSPAVVYDLFLFGQHSTYYGGTDREYVFARGLAAAGGGSVQFSRPWKDSLTTVSLIMASGDSDHPLFSDAGGGVSYQFSTLTNADLGGVYPLVLSNIVRAGAEYTIIPVDTLAALRIGGSVHSVLRPAAGAGTLEDTNTDGTPAGYMGTEFGLSAGGELFPDLELKLGAAFFVPTGEYRTSGIFPEHGLPCKISLVGRYRISSQLPTRR